MAELLFSIIVPAYNAGEKLAKTVESVLNQRGPSFELIVVDGGSSDNTLALLERYQGALAFVSEPDRGVYDAMNKGIARSHGKYLYFLGAGDTLREGALARIAQVAPAEGMALVYGNVLFQTIGKVYDGPFDKTKLAIRNFSHQAAFYERSLFAEFGSYDVKYPIVADWVLNLKCFGNDRVRKIYVDFVVADFEGGGMSDGVYDRQFLQDYGFLIRRYLHLSPLQSAFVAVERRLRSRVSRKPAFRGQALWFAALSILYAFGEVLLDRQFSMPEEL